MVEVADVARFKQAAEQNALRKLCSRTSCCEDKQPDKLDTD